MPYSALRIECLRANLALSKKGLVDLTFGNVSVADPDRRVFCIKPSGVAYDRLEASSMIVLDYEGRVLEGVLRPSSDTPTHRRLFLNFPGIRSVVHTHSRSAVAFAQAARELPCLGTTHADYFHGPVPVTREMTPGEVSGDYEWETGKVIVERFAGIDPLETPAVLVAGHGPFVWGPAAMKAVENAEALEIVASMALNTLSLAPDSPGLPRHLLDKHFGRKHGATAYYGQARDAS